MKRLVFFALLPVLRVCSQPAERVPAIEIFGGPSFANLEHGAQNLPPATSPSNQKANFFGA